MNSFAIEVEGVRCSYGAFTAVRDVSLQVKNGEIYALLGTNGAGKTTLLETIQGFRKSNSGHVMTFGVEPDNTIRHRIGFMLQESALVGELTAGETVAFFGSASGRSDSVQRALSVVGLFEKEKVKVSQLSGGERRRLDFASAIYGNPDLVFLDEPTAGMDPEARSDLWASVADMRARGTSFLITTHYLEEAEQHADRIGLIHQGELVLEGALSEINAGLPATISFRTRIHDVVLPFDGVTWTGFRTEIRTQDLQATLLTLLRWAEREGCRLDDLTAEQPSLRQVFESLKDDD